MAAAVVNVDLDEERIEALREEGRLRALSLAVEAARSGEAACCLATLVHALQLLWPDLERFEARAREHGPRAEDRAQLDRILLEIAEIVALSGEESAQLGGGAALRRAAVELERALQQARLPAPSGSAKP